jgi:hypothetical protein
MSTETKVTKDYFEFGTIKYFRGKAENAKTCSYGEKKHPMGGAPYLAVQAKVNRAYLKDRVDYITAVKVDWSQQSEAAMEVNGRLKYFDLNGKVAVSGSYQNVKSAKLELVKFTINEGPLKGMLNRDADGARKYLAEEGADGRIPQTFHERRQPGLRSRIDPVQVLHHEQEGLPPAGLPHHLPQHRKGPRFALLGVEPSRRPRVHGHIQELEQQKRLVLGCYPGLAQPLLDGCGDGRRRG